MVTAATFSTAVIGSLLLLDEIDSNRIMEAYLEYGMFNESLRSLGKMYYYPEFAIKEGALRAPTTGKYRVGVFPELPSLDQRRVEERGA